MARRPSHRPPPPPDPPQRRSEPPRSPHVEPRRWARDNRRGEQVISALLRHRALNLRVFRGGWLWMHDEFCQADSDHDPDPEPGSRSGGFSGQETHGNSACPRSSAVAGCGSGTIRVAPASSPASGGIRSRGGGALAGLFTVNGGRRRGKGKCW